MKVVTGPLRLTQHKQTTTRTDGDTYWQQEHVLTIIKRRKLQCSNVMTRFLGSLLKSK